MKDAIPQLINAEGTGRNRNVELKEVSKEGERCQQEGKCHCSRCTCNLLRRTVCNCCAEPDCKGAKLLREWSVKLMLLIHSLSPVKLWAQSAPAQLLE